MIVFKNMHRTLTGHLERQVGGYMRCWALVGGDLLEDATLGPEYVMM
jgi:hypothetical protein